MLTVDSFEVRPRTLDMTSSEQGRPAATAIEYDGIRLFNALEYLQADPYATQVEICEQCGSPGCQTGGWISFSRLGESVIWMPAWSQLQGERSLEYRPPAYFQDKGIPIFSRKAWDELRLLTRHLPARDDLPRMDSRDMVRLIQYLAPGLMLGKFPDEAILRRELIIAAEDGDASSKADSIDNVMHQWHSDPKPIGLAPRTGAPVKLWLELPGTPEWIPCWSTPDGDTSLTCGELIVQRSPEAE